MTAVRHAVILAVLCIGLAGRPAVAQEPITQCADWSADLAAKVPRDITLSELKYLATETALEVTPLRGSVRAETVTIKLRDRDAVAGAHDGSVLVAIEGDDASPMRGPLVRLGIRTVAVDAKTDDYLDFVRFRLHGDTRPTDIGADVFEALDCVEVPGDRVLVPKAPIEGKGEKNLLPPRSLEDIGKSGVEMTVIIPAEPPRSLTEIGRGDAGLGGLPSDTPKRSLEDLATAEDATGPEKPPAKTPASPPVATPAADPTGDTIAPPAETAMCDRFGIALDAAPGLEAAPFLTVGQRSSAREVGLWAYNDIVDQAMPTGETGVLTTADGVMEPVEIVRSFRSADQPVRHLLRPILPDSLRLTPGEAPEALPVVLSVRLFGDARMIALSGLDALDADLADLLPAGTLKILWHEIQPDGQIGTLREADRFSDLVATARALPETDVSYSSKTTMQTFADGLARVLASSETTTDLAVWVLEGVLLPDETPAILSDMIARVGRDGNIRRFLPGDGRPRRWLHVVSGQFAQMFSESYIRGPVLRADPPIGEMDVERDSGRDKRTLLDDTGKLATALSNHIKRNLAALDLPEGPGGAGPVDAYLDGVDGYDNIGILLPTGQTTEWLDAVGQSLRAIQLFRDGTPPDEAGAAKVDLSALLLVKSTKAGLATGLVAPTGSERQRLSRLETIGLLDDYEALLKQLTLQLNMARSVSAADCGHVFIDLGD